MQNPNRTDQPANDFFHSKLFKILLILFVIFIIIPVLSLCCIYIYHHPFAVGVLHFRF